MLRSLVGSEMCIRDSSSPLLSSPPISMPFLLVSLSPLSSPPLSSVSSPLLSSPLLSVVRATMRGGGADNDAWWWWPWCVWSVLAPRECSHAFLSGDKRTWCRLTCTVPGVDGRSPTVVCILRPDHPLFRKIFIPQQQLLVRRPIWPHPGLSLIHI